MAMITVDDIFHKIAQDIRSYSGVDQEAAVDEFIQGCQFDLHLAITKNVEDTELSFLNRYGHGHTFYFRLANYEQGKTLASDMYWILYAQRPEMNGYTGEQFEDHDKLFLFVHIRDVIPPPLTHVII
jgi:hypothetical protein